jgi:hypothetical protein
MEKKQTSLTEERLREVLHYDLQTGNFTWRKSGSWRRTNKAHPGTVAGWVYRGRRSIRIDGQNYFAHRLAWLWVIGEWPPHPYEIDHKDCNPLNNCWSNLRACSATQNSANKGRLIRNTSGAKGVSWETRDGKWRAQIRVKGKSIHLGYRVSMEEAASLYAAAAREIFGEFARTE